MRLRVTLACFFAYFVMSGMLAPIGIVLPSLAEFLAVPVESAAALFSWLTFGILLGSALALVVFDMLSMRVWLAILYLAIAVALLLLRLTESLMLIKLALGVVGTACGIGLAGAASTITQLYAEDRRASMLVITDGSFSVAGIVVSSLAVFCVAAGFHWAAAYVAVAGVALVIVALVLTSPVPDAPKRAATMTSSGRWPLPVWLCIAALFLYTLGQYSLLWWLPSYLELTLGAERDAAGQVVARFWTGMLIAQLFVAWWVLRIGARRLVLLCVMGAFVGSIPLWTVGELSLLPWLALLWGIANLGLLKIVIAFATLAVTNPGPRLVAALLFGATSGTAISPAATSVIAANSSIVQVLRFGSLCYFVLMLLVFGAWLASRQSNAEHVRTP
ncbi:MAG: hypothetical protein Cons2KO_11160 [Congregibacter sp.]